MLSSPTENDRPPVMDLHLDEGVRLLYDMSKDQLVQAVLEGAKNWFDHDGLWFQAVESAHGRPSALEAYRAAWERFTVAEAKQIMERLGLKPGGGIPALVSCLKQRLCARLNLQQVVELSDTTVVLRVVECRVQSARQREGAPDLPCRSLGMMEFAGFARTIDPCISTRCIGCPPDPHPQYYCCAWEFTLKRAGVNDR